MRKVILIILILYSYVSIGQTITGSDVEDRDLNKELKEKKDEIILKSSLAKMKIDSLFQDVTTKNDKLKSIDSEKDSAIKIEEAKFKDKLTNPEYKDFRFFFAPLVGLENKKYGTATGEFWGKLEGDLADKRTTLLSTSLVEVRGTLYSELILDYIGAFRISVATSLTASKLKDDKDKAEDQKIKDAVQSFQSSGGNFILKSDFPLIYWTNINVYDSNGTKSEEPYTRFMALFFSPRVCMNLPSLGGTADEPTGHVDIGAEIQYSFLTNKKLIGIQGRLRGAVVLSSKDYVKTLTDKEGRSNFAYLAASIVLNIKDVFSIYLNFPISKNSKRPIDRQPVSLSVTPFKF